MTEQDWLPDDVRLRAGNAIRTHRDSLVADLDDSLATALPDLPAGDLRARLVHRTIELLAAAMAGSSLAENAGVADFAHLQQEGLTRQGLFEAVRLAERSILHELSVDAEIGATSDHWPAITLIARRASFDLLGSVFDYSLIVARSATDPRTMLVPRAMFEMVVAKELQRGVRYHHPVALVLLRVDDLSDINQKHGYGVGDLLMERMGVLLQRYFREPDWVARYTADSVAVLLPETSAPDARSLAEGARQAIEERLAFPDKDERPVRVTASASVVTVAIGGKSSDGDGRETWDAPRMISEAEAGAYRARARGGNTVECVEMARDSVSVSEAAAYLQCSPGAVRKLVTAGMLPAVQSDGRTRIDRLAVEAYRRRQRPRKSI